MGKFIKEYKTDVLVVGAGASGIPAAIGAARAGAKVILIDEDPYPGGAAVDMGVCAYCGLPRTGIVKEVEDILIRTEKTSGHQKWFMPSSWMTVYAGLLYQAKVKLILNTKATEAIVREIKGKRQVMGVKAQKYKGKIIINAAVTIDATGNGSIALSAGAHGMYGEDSQKDFGENVAPPKRTNKVQNLTWMYISQREPGRRIFDMTKLENFNCGVLVEGLGWWKNDPEKAIKMDVPRYLHWGCTVICKDTRDPWSIGEACRKALQMMERDHAMLRENGYTIQLAPKIGIRESWRIEGDHVISLCDLRSGKYPEDKIAEGWYGIDIWGKKKELNVDKPLPPYGIPYRALLPKGIDGLLITGRAMSGTHIAMSAYRVMPIVGAAGQSAGIAAALCVKHKTSPRLLDYKLIQKSAVHPSQNIRLNWSDK